MKCCLIKRRGSTMTSLEKRKAGTRASSHHSTSMNFSKALTSTSGIRDSITETPSTTTTKTPSDSAGGISSILMTCSTMLRTTFSVAFILMVMVQEGLPVRMPRSTVEVCTLILGTSLMIHSKKKKTCLVAITNTAVMPTSTFSTISIITSTSTAMGITKTSTPSASPTTLVSWWGAVVRVGFCGDGNPFSGGFGVLRKYFRNGCSL